MAYLRGLPIDRCNGAPDAVSCNQTATVELINKQLNSCGRYCQRCGNKALKRLQAQEAEDDKTRRTKHD